ncbi:flagellar assembly protein FliW [Clostridium tagluense]|uniref:flagellar assembly protein FliW n=1 Tax=Clostridium tagluense TaxID=360422 RepID=UPI001CF3CF39|nr:flagellar assembly protein FliW [Clostridium tagluense]MCB2310042.1 flagellar assembly protein FliW [Clostridium tagluense]MCB2314428.1 flagellar assembly protein FliW [Clostridium tagluense]MCB2319274.1 flagellar assembly protein FliW [Clostridium tagluense]MCB2324636.1 flagellar assembly protein FliW [Clostridium tagluense]MCB2329487.1 flagellar assembly protein FliW [Clostridium tagluense]
MELVTKYHGVREYSTEDVIVFKKGIPGFKELKNFIIFPLESNEVFSILHSIEDSEVGLVLVSPFTILADYEFKIPDNDIKELQIVSPEQVLVLTTVTLDSNIENMTTNLKAPIIINIKEKLGEQLILDNDKYKIKESLFKSENN